ncbi:MAG: hypothetical protein KBG20_10810 [Caldilineaceae bacterium]|nr:hypothetical protein [Caldilineaceae bacterium]MBP8107178.1 hypothetical protein [Caldilineaceae bacterium]MBP8122213.1 hypothetical protein [Caldilineaceae bacterium]MBP9072784.1 hypothetical protein [Caldilineaceae bacterium]
MPDILTLLLVVLVALLVWAAFSPFEALGWWAGWFGDRVYYEPLPPEGLVRTTKPNPDAFVVFMSGVGRVSGQTLSRREQGFLQALAETLPNTVVIDDIFPYSVNSLPLTGQPFFASLWRWALRRKLSGRRLEGFAGMLINARNIFQVTMSADKRYGPIYNQAMAHVIIHGLTRYGYHPEDPRPLFLMGYSGAGQVTMGAATYLKEWLTGPVVLISLGGIFANDPGVLAADHTYHLFGSQDRSHRIGAICSPGRWPIFAYSFWNQAKRLGKVEFVFMGEMGHTGKGGYLDVHSLLPDGTNYLAHTVHVVADLIEGYTPTR